MEKKIKEAWLESYLINIFYWLNKFVSDNWFGEIIIMLNKKNINLSANAKFDKFLQKTILQNVLSLYNSKEAILQVTGLTSYSNCYSTIGSYPNVYYLVKLFTKKLVFYEQLERDANKPKLPDFFTNSSILLSKRVLLTDYINSF